MKPKGFQANKKAGLSSKRIKGIIDTVGVFELHS